MNKLFFILPVLVLALVSCGDDDPVNTTVMYRNCATKIIDNDNEKISANSSTAIFTVDYVSNKAQITINNLSDKITSISIPEMSIKYASDGFSYTINETNSLSAIVNGVEALDYTISNFRCNSTIYIDSDNVTSEDFLMQFNLTDPKGETVLVQLGLTEYNFLNTTTTVAMGPTKQYVWEEAYYTIKLSSDVKSAEIVLNNIRFVEQMRALDGMQFKNVALTPTANGYILESAQLIPEIDDTPYKQYAITNLSGTITGTTAVLNFTCMGMNVNAQLDIVP